MKSMRVLLFMMSLVLVMPVFAQEKSQSSRIKSPSTTDMSQTKMETYVRKLADVASGGKGMVEFSIANITMYLISDVNHDRMRIVAPVAEYDKLSRTEIDAAMASNYHLALDARYAVSEGILMSVYVHPISSLTEDQINSAIFQVANLAKTFGSDYTSGVLSFGEEQETL